MEHIYTKSYKSTRLTVNARLIYCLIFLLLFTGSLIDQVSTLKLSTNTNTSKFSMLNNSSTNLFTVFGDGTVGINQILPNATLEIGGLS